MNLADYFLNLLKVTIQKSISEKHFQIFAENDECNVKFWSDIFLLLSRRFFCGFPIHFVSD